LSEPGGLGLRLNFPEPYKASNLKISFSIAKTLQNSEIYNEIDTATLKVAEHSFLVPMRYSSLFSNHWPLGSQNWQDASSTKKDYILIHFIGQSAIAMATQLVINQH